MPCWGPAIPPPPILPHFLSGSSCRQPTRTIRPSGETSEGHPGPFRSKGPLNGMRAGASPSSPLLLSLIRILLHLAFPSISLSQSLGSSLEFSISSVYFQSVFELALMLMHVDLHQFLMSTSFFVSPIFRNVSRKLFPLSAIIRTTLIIIVFAIATILLVLVLIITQLILLTIFISFYLRSFSTYREKLLRYG